MSVENIFPHFSDRNVPETLSKIFLYVNYSEDIQKFRLVSRGWRYFLDREILEKPNMKKPLLKKQFVDQWINWRPLRKKTLELKPGYLPDQTYMAAGGDCIFVTGHLSTNIRTCIYKNCEYVGYVLTRDTPSLAPCRDFFVDLNYSQTRSSLHEIQAYYEQGNVSSLRLLPRPLMQAPSTGRRMLLLKRVGNDLLLLVCVEEATGNIVITNLADESENIVSVSRIGSQRNGLPFPHRNDTNSAVDATQLVIFWQEDNFLQMIDHVKGEEVWVQDIQNLPTNFTCTSIKKSAKFTVLSLCTSTYNCVLDFFDNRTGRLIGRFSPTKLPTRLIAAGNTLMWCTYHDHEQRFTVYTLKVREGRLSRLEARKALCVYCRKPVSYLLQMGAIKSRLVLMQYYCSCRMDEVTRYGKYYVAYDLMDDDQLFPIPLLDSDYRCVRLDYFDRVLQDGKVLNKDGNVVEVLDFDLAS